jgi:hypothetical protein
MRIATIFLSICTRAGGSTQAIAQASAPQYPVAADVQSLDGMIRAFYEVVSTPAGARPNRERDASLHASGAQIRLSRTNADGRPALQVLSLAELYELVGGERKQAYYEREIHRVTQRFGSIAHVWSTYVTSDTPSGAPVDRGISSIQLYFDGSRWWITGWTDEGERPGSPIPAEFLPDSRGR